MMEWREFAGQFLVSMVFCFVAWIFLSKSARHQKGNLTLREFPDSISAFLLPREVPECNFSNEFDSSGMPKLEICETVEENLDAIIVSTSDHENAKELMLLEIGITKDSDESTECKEMQEKAGFTEGVELADKDIEFLSNVEQKRREDREGRKRIASTSDLENTKDLLLLEAGITKESCRFKSINETEDKVEFELPVIDVAFQLTEKENCREESEDNIMLIIDNESTKEPILLESSISEESSELGGSKGTEEILGLKHGVEHMEAELDFHLRANDKCREEGKESISTTDDKDAKEPVVIMQASITEDSCSIGGAKEMEKKELTCGVELTETDAGSCSTERIDGEFKVDCRVEEKYKEESEETVADCTAKMKHTKESEKSLVGEMSGEEFQANIELCAIDINFFSLVDERSREESQTDIELCTTGTKHGEEREERRGGSSKVIVDGTPGSTMEEMIQGEGEETRDTKAKNTMNKTPGNDTLTHKTDATISDIDDIDDWVRVSHLEQRFFVALSYVKRSASDQTSRFSYDVQSQFEALEKQATMGPCITAPPAAYRLSARTKWQAWQNLGPSMSSEEAMQQYITLLSSVQPIWDEGMILKKNVMEEEVGGRSLPPALLNTAFNLSHEYTHGQELGNCEGIHRYAREGSAGGIAPLFNIDIPTKQMGGSYGDLSNG